MIDRTRATPIELCNQGVDSTVFEAYAPRLFKRGGSTPLSDLFTAHVALQKRTACRETLCFFSPSPEESSIFGALALESVAAMVRLVTSLSIEDIYADPHRLDFFLASGEAVAVLSNGEAVADLVPRKRSQTVPPPAGRPEVDYRARFLNMWGSDALRSELSVAEDFMDLRRDRGE